MRDGHWDREKALFLDALDQPADERAAFVARASGDDQLLRASVESLLAAHDTSSGFMETPAAALSLDAVPEPLPGAGRVGPYRLLREIGRGGMGTVYVAVRDDGEFTHQVAVKLVKRGMDTDLILARFRHERQILAGLDHPNIARLLDGGTTVDGLPYFVMEFVDGTSLREFCRRRDLSVDQRLVLFRTVCAAVEHAHQNLVVHRDIKSGNIVVTDAGVPKLLDFGIAKLLDPAIGEPGAAATATLSAMTPEYASPEQIRGEPVTTTTDVYSLGVLLYELLTGQRPFGLSDRRPEEIARAVCETEPTPPSVAVGGTHTTAWRGHLRGDLDTIVLMAMRKDPTRRYPSVAQLSEDIERYRSGRPVRAQRDTLRYRCAKFARRNRLILSATVVTGVFLVGGVAATLWQASVARAERARAERRFAEVRSLATSFLFEVHDAISTLPGATPARALLLTRGLTSLDGLARESQGDPLLQRELAVAYQRVGLVQGNSYNSNLGDTKGALLSYGHSVRLLEGVVASDARDPEALHELAGAYKGLADMLNITGDLQNAVINFERARASLQRAVALRPANTEYRRALANLLFEIGDTQGGASLANVGDTKGALASYRAAIALRRALRVELPDDVEVRAGLANSLLNLGSLQLTLGDTTGETGIREGVALLEAIVAVRPNDAFRRIGLLSGYMRLRQRLADQGRYDEAIAIDRRTLASLEQMVAADTQNTAFRRNLGVTFNTLGRDLRAAGDAARAIENHRRALAIVERLIAADSSSSEHRQDLAVTRGMLADALLDARQYAPALEQYQQAIALKESMRVAEPSTERHGDDLAGLYAGIGAVRLAQRDHAGAARAFRTAIPLADAAVERPSVTIRAQSTGASVYAGVGRLHAQQSEQAATAVERVGFCRDAARWYQRGIAIWDAMQKSGSLSVLDAGRRAAAAIGIARCGVR